MPDADRPHPLHAVRLEPSGWRFDAPGNAPLLHAARQAGITLPSSCRNGTCRACLCRLVEGRVGYRIEWPGLSREEKDEGFILPCVAHPESDLLIDAPRAERRAAPGRPAVPGATQGPLRVPGDRPTYPSAEGSS